MNIESQDSKIFIMYGVREILALTPGALQIEKQVEAIEDSIYNNPSLVFDLSKAIVETVCKTIMKDRGVPYEEDVNLKSLFNNTIGLLKLLPDEHSDNEQLKRGMKHILSGLHKITDGLCDIRNAHGIASHGRDAYAFDIEDSIYAQIIARATDSVVSFLFKIHKQQQSGDNRDLAYDDKEYEEFNDFIDTSHASVKILKSEFIPSQVLYQMDRLAYIEYHKDYKNSDDE